MQEIGHILVAFWRKLVAFFCANICVYEKKAVILQRFLKKGVYYTLFGT